MIFGAMDYNDKWRSIATPENAEQAIRYEIYLNAMEEAVRDVLQAWMDKDVPLTTLAAAIDENLVTRISGTLPPPEQRRQQIEGLFDTEWFADGGPPAPLLVLRTIREIYLERILTGEADSSS